VAFSLPAESYGSRQLRVTADNRAWHRDCGSADSARTPRSDPAHDRQALVSTGSNDSSSRARVGWSKSRAAESDKPITLELKTEKENKVFKKHDRTDRFGVASADFELADEVNFGAYHIRAILGEAEAASTQEKTVTVDRYVLPKFKVEVELSGGPPRSNSRAITRRARLSRKRSRLTIFW